MKNYTTFHLKTGKCYQNLKIQSTLCQSVMPVKYIILLSCPLKKKGLFSERHQAEATKAGSKCLAENAFKANSKVKR